MMTIIGINGNTVFGNWFQGLTVQLSIPEGDWACEYIHHIQWYMECSYYSKRTYDCPRARIQWGKSIHHWMASRCPWESHGCLPREWLHCYNCYNVTSIYVYIRLRLIEEINHDRPLFSNVASARCVKNPLGKATGLRLEAWVTMLMTVLELI